MLAAILLIARGQDTVTFSHPCASSTTVLAALGRQLGEVVKPSGSVLQDYIAVKLTNRSAEEAKRLIAEALDAEWVQKPGVLYLDRGAKQHLAESQRSDKQLRAGIEKYLADSAAKQFDIEKLKRAMIETSRARANGQSTSQAYSELMQLMPESMFGPNLVAALGVDRLVAMREGDAIEFFLTSDGKTDMPSPVLSAVKTYQRQLALVADFSATHGGENMVEFGFDRLGATSSNMRLVVSRSDGMINAVVHENATTLNGSYSSSRSIAYVQKLRPAPVRAKIEGITGKLALDERGERVLRVFRSKFNLPNQALPIDQEDVRFARGLATDLVANEILAIVGDAPLWAVAGQAGRDFVMIVPDEQATRFSWIARSATSDLADIWGSWAGSLDIVEDPGTKALLGRPVETAWVRDRRFDRAATSRFVAAFVQNGRNTLDALASLAVATSSSREFQTNGTVAALFLPVRSFDPYSWPVLKSYGSLGGAQRKQARENGVVVPWRNLPQAARDEIGQRLTRNQTLYAESPIETVDWSHIGMAYRGTKPPIRATLASVPSDAQVRITVLTNTLLKPQPGLYSSTSAMTPENLAMYRGSSSGGELSDDYSRAAVVKVERVQLEIFVPGVGYTNIVAQVDDSTTDTKYVPLTELPEPYKSKVADAIKLFRGGGPPLVT